MLSSHIPEAMLEEKKEPVSIASQDIERAIISPTPIKYLQGFSAAEIEAFQENYKLIFKKESCSLSDLENLLEENPRIYRYYLFNFAVANYGSCLLFLTFPITACNEAIQSFAKIFDSRVTVSNWVGYGIGGPLSVLDVVFFMFVFSVRVEAVRASLDYIIQKTYLEQVKDALIVVRERPVTAMKTTMAFILAQAILQPFNMTGTISELVYLPMDFSTPESKIAIIVTLFYGNEYFKVYLNPKFRQGIIFFKNPTQRPGLIQDILRGNLSLPFQILFQSASSIGLRAFPVYYAIAVAAEEALSWWFSPFFVAACTVLHGILTLYPSTFDHYMKDHEDILFLLKKNPKFVMMVQEIARVHDIAPTEQNIKRIEYELSMLWRNAFFEKQRQQRGSLILFKSERMTGCLILMRAFLGGYFGYGLGGKLAVLLNKTLAQALLIPLASLTFGKLLYNAEKQYFINDSYANELKKQEEKSHHAPEYSTGIIAGALVLTCSGALVGAMTTIGTLNSIIGDNEPEITTAIAILSVERMLNSGYFNFGGVLKTVQDLYQSSPSVSGLFSRAFCCRRNRIQPPVPNNGLALPAPGR
jgi:hypothetical protein